MERIKFTLCSELIWAILFEVLTEKGFSQIESEQVLEGINFLSD